MKKIGLSLLGIVAVAAIYYFTSGSEQLTIQMKQHVDTELASLQTKGFAVEGREVSEKKEHFVISFDDTKKVTAFLNAQGAQVTEQDIEPLKGLKIGVDVTYLADAYSAASFDIYPMAFPNMEVTSKMNENDKKTLKDIQRMLEEKTFLAHVDVNKLGTGFKGYMKDINEVIDGEHTITIKMTALKFNGDLKDDKLSAVTQTLKNVTIKGDNDAFNMQLNNLKSNYAITGDTKYDYTTGYTIEEMLVTTKDEFKLSVNSMTMNSTSEVNNNLASITAQTEINSIHFTEGQKTSTLKTLIFDMKADNFDMAAIEKLETINPNNEEELLATFQQLISKGVRLEIPNFSVKNLEFENEKLDGFKLTSSFDIDKDLDLSTLEQNPMAAIGAMNANLNLTLSEQLFGFIAKQPQAVMVMMMIQPKDVNGDKVYTVELKNGKLSVNGKPMI